LKVLVLRTAWIVFFIAPSGNLKMSVVALLWTTTPPAVNARVAMRVRVFVVTEVLIAWKRPIAGNRRHCPAGAGDC
jgi:hypothetical protein